MLANLRHHKRARRGIVLVLVLAMLALLALIGVTFATFSGQSKINARNFAQSVIQPQDDELMDFALSQLITDTEDPRSVLRGHSLARDMYGNDAGTNGYLNINPVTGGPLLFTNIQAVTGTAFVDVLTNLPIPSVYSGMYGYNFRRWIVRLSYAGPSPTTNTVLYPYAVSQTFEVLIDDFAAAAGVTTFSGNGFHAFRLSPIDLPQAINSPQNTSGVGTVMGTALNNPTLGFTTPNGFPGWDSPSSNNNSLPLAYIPTQPALSQFMTFANPTNPQTSLGLPNYAPYTNLANYPFVLDGRWLRAFNGPGMGSQSTTITIGNVTLSVPLSTYGNFRYNGLTPSTVGMDEDYDACDLENWFLAIQSADGQVNIPSFHRPGILRYDPNNLNLPANDWSGVYRFPPALQGFPNTDSLGRILRPVAADGNDAATFPDLIPDPVTGKITYDVDNDGDGVTDSVWLDLGYPARRDSRGQLYKPLFAFMVIGLNGRIPLNTAGNLAGSGATHAQHLGNSVSEIDPTYGLQNAYNPIYGTSVVAGDVDPFNSLGNGALPSTIAWAPLGLGTYPTFNAQVDNTTTYNTTLAAPAWSQNGDVRTTQLRNLLAGTRPQVNPFLPDTTGLINGDTNVVFGSWPGVVTGPGSAYALPNSIADFSDNVIFTGTDANGNPLPFVQRTAPPVGGRWGEATSISGVPYPNPNPNGPPVNLVQTNYANPVRAGYSFDPTDLFTSINAGTAYDSSGDPMFPRDAADDNYNAFDVFPPRLTGEIGDLDFYDSAGALILPAERMRRFVTPVDINGTGSVQMWNGSSTKGYDNFGRVQFSSYFRPAGGAAPINITTTASSPAGAYPYGAITPPVLVPTPTSPAPPFGPGTWSAGSLTPWSAGTTYVPDVTNNPLHSYEFYKFPNQLLQVPGTPTAPPSTLPSYNPQRLGGTPITPILASGVVNQQSNALSAAYLEQYGAIATTAMTPGNIPTTWTTNPPTQTAPNLPTVLPTYNNTVNSAERSDGVNEADEMNLYAPNPRLDSPYGPTDLEWLYRQQDVDGAELTSPLSQLAPVSFTNTIDGQRRRRLYATHTWETNNFVWANDNPGGAFQYNARFTAAANASFANLPGGPYTPSLAHRDRKINLNYPLPVSNDCNEPVRQKWITDTYQLLTVILPPDSVDTAEERAQLGQFVINIIDFRDPDATMTHWVNPDVFLTPSTASTNYPTLTLSIGGGNLDQYGMEYNPVAINEVLAYSFQSRLSPYPTATATYTNRFFIELVNTLTTAYNPTFDYSSPATYVSNNFYGYGPNPVDTTASYSAPTVPNQASTINLGGFSYTASDPYGGGCWDLVFTADNPGSRPDPYRGELPGNTTAGITTYYSLIPLNRDSLTQTMGGMGGANTAAPNEGDATLIPLITSSGNPNPATRTSYPSVATASGPPINYFYVIGNPQNATSATVEPSPPTQNASAAFSSVTQWLTTAFDPVAFGGTGPTTLSVRPGVLPGLTQATLASALPKTFYTPKIPSNAGSALYYWVCLRRPANPFAPVSATNPMCVVDSMRFPYVDGTGTKWASDGKTPPSWQVTGAANTIYSSQRLQPYRGGHAVPQPMPVMAGTTIPPDARYGYTEQIADPQSYASTNSYGKVSTTTTYPSTNYMYHTLGVPNDSAENWDYLVFNDRDFSSVAELMLVPGCPPGLFTKQFVEFAPSLLNAANIFSTVTPVSSPSFTANNNGTTPTAASPAALNAFATATYPFLSVSEGTAGAIGATLPTSVPAFPTTGTHKLTLAQPTGGTISTPVVPHAYPYLVDKFFYSGASTFLYPPLVPPNTTNGMTAVTALGGAGATDPSNGSQPVVGGPAGDGWFKMFDFFEVPSQMIGSIGPVANGANFDWARQDTKPGLMNLNLIIDEEAFFSVFGDQSSSYSQNLLNSIELPLLAVPNQAGQLSLPYGMPLSISNIGVPPFPLGVPPVPLVVSAIQATGAPNYVYPVTDQTQYLQHGFLTTDPILQQFVPATAYNILTPNGLATLPAVGNRIKAAFAQFLSLRHGGSGYLFGYGGGVTGQNSAVATVIGQVNGQQIPAERPFRSLSFPDINYTIMRPAALPPSAPITMAAGGTTISSNPAMIPNNKIPALTAVTNAQSLIYTPATLPTNWFWVNQQLGATPGPTTEPNYYAPFITTASPGYDGEGPYFPANTPVVFTGDPGVRNPFLSQGYATIDANYTPPYPVYPTQATNSVPAGVPLPLNFAYVSPGAGAMPMPTLVVDSVVMPSAIPPARLFQAPDDFGAGKIQTKGYIGIPDPTGNTAGNLPPALSNATDSGDPWINNLVANQGADPWYNNVANLLPMYTLSNGFPSLVWAGGTFYSNAGTTYPILTPTGVLPPTAVTYPPYGQWYNNTVVPGSLTVTGDHPYLGSNSTGGNTDDRQHPYWRSELMQKAINLTTVRTHQYAVWITIGFFEVKKAGDIGMLGQGLPQLAYDIMGAEVGALSGNNVRYRGFFIVDRLKLTGFNLNSAGQFRNAILYRKIIQ
jgi:hypothetical protein